MRIALAHKDLDYEYELVHLVDDGGQQNAADFVDKNPARQVPVLEVEIDGTRHHLGQSLAIIEFLEETYPEPPFIASDRFVRARTRQLAEVINAGTQPLQNLKVIQTLNGMDVDAKAWCREFISAGLHAYQDLCLPGTYSAGDAVSWADACLIPQLYNARRFKLDLSGLQRLVDIEAACFELSSFSDTHPSKMPEATE